MFNLKSLLSKTEETVEDNTVIITVQKTGQIISNLYRYIYELKQAGKVGGTMQNSNESYQVKVYKNWVFITAIINGQLVAENATIDELETILISMQPEYNNI